jgi:hypothetical protein
VVGIRDRLPPRQIETIGRRIEHGGPALGVGQNSVRRDTLSGQEVESSTCAGGRTIACG